MGEGRANRFLRWSRIVGRPPESPAPLALGIVLTSVAWVIARLVVSSLRGDASGPLPNYFWAEWDSINYIHIAMHGRTYGLCGAPGVQVGKFAYLISKHPWCGDALWFPCYPWMIRTLHFLDFTYLWSATLVSWLASAGMIFLGWFGWCRDLSPRRSLVVLLIFGLFPGAVYSFAIFPMSVALFFIVAAILLASRGRFMVAALAMVMAGLCHPSAWFAAVGLAAGLVVLATPLGSRETLKKIGWGALGLASIPILFLHDQLAFGHWNAFLVLQRQSDRGHLLSVNATARNVADLVTGKSFEQQRMGAGAVFLTLQAILAVLMTGYAVVFTFSRRWWGKWEPRQVYAGSVAAFVLLGTAVNSDPGAWNRSIVLAAPCVFCLRMVPKYVLVAILIVVGGTTAVVSHYFFNGALI